MGEGHVAHLKTHTTSTVTEEILLLYGIAPLTGVIINPPQQSLDLLEFPGHLIGWLSFQSSNVKKQNKKTV